MHNHIIKVSTTCRWKDDLGNNCSENLKVLHTVNFQNLRFMICIVKIQVAGTFYSKLTVLTTIDFCWVVFFSEHLFTLAHTNDVLSACELEWNLDFKFSSILHLVSLLCIFKGAYKTYIFVKSHGPWNRNL